MKKRFTANTFITFFIIFLIGVLVGSMLAKENLSITSIIDNGSSYSVNYHNGSEDIINK